jgi:hypothetical protein
MSTNPYRYDVFISYRRQEPDKAFARWLLKNLTAAGYRVAFDEIDFSPQATFLNEMERCCRESRFVLAVISPRYFESGNTDMESTIVTVQGMRNRNNRLIPLVFEEVERPTWMYSLVGVTFTDKDPLVPPLERLKAAMGEPLARKTSQQNILPPTYSQPNRAVNQELANQPGMPKELQKRLRLKEEYERKLERYRRKAKELLRTKSEIDEFARKELKSCQKYLGLSDEVISQIETTLCQEFVDAGQPQKNINICYLDDFLQLEVALRKGNFIEADRQTYFLIEQASRSKDSDFFSKRGESFIQANYINNVTCDFLLEIDSLWRDFSKNKYGFTAQKNVWEEIAKQTKSSNPVIFYKFSSRIGWFREEEKEWVDPKQLNFNLDAPPGHLPTLGYGIGNDAIWRKAWGHYFMAFLLRIIECQNG